MLQWRLINNLSIKHGFEWRLSAMYENTNVGGAFDAGLTKVKAVELKA